MECHAWSYVLIIILIVQLGRRLTDKGTHIANPNILFITLKTKCVQSYLTSDLNFVYTIRFARQFYAYMILRMSHFFQLFNLHYV